MSFMEAQAVNQKMLHVETEQGTELVPSDLVAATPTASELQQFCEGTVQVHASGDVDCRREEGWYSRFSAPGYMDRTDWQGPYESSEKALDELAESHDCCRKCWEQCWDNPAGGCEAVLGKTGAAD